MKWLYVSFVATLTITLIFTSVSGFKCYVCDTYKDPIGCGKENLNSSYLQECESIHGPREGYFCRIITQNIDNLMDVSDERTIRQCGWIPYEFDRDCYYRAGFGSRQNVCKCDKPECNAASYFPTSWLLIMTTIIASLSLRQLL